MKRKLFRACFAGFLGTIVVTCMVIFASPTLIGGPSDIASVLARMLGGTWLAGMAAHFFVGTVALPLIYLAAMNRRLPGGPAVRGAIWGFALWLFSQVVVLPLAGGGFFGLASGAVRPILDSLVGHLAYGLVLGVFAGDPNERVFSIRHETIPEEPPLRRAA